MTFEFAAWEYYLAATQLILATLGMGVALTPRDFWGVLRAPKALALVLAAQLVLTPLLALGLARWLALPPGFAAGLILMTALPAGTMANIFVYLGRGNAPLSISATAISTLGSLATTALVLRLYGAVHFPGDFSMPVDRIILEIGAFLLIPLALAMTLRRLAPGHSQQVGKWCIRGSLVVLTTIVIGSLTSGRLPIAAYGWFPPGVLVLFGGLTMAACYGLGYLCGLRLADSFTVALLVTIRNGNLGLLLKAKLFPAIAGFLDPVGNGVLYVVLFYSGTSLVLALAAVASRRARERAGATSLALGR